MSVTYIDLIKQVNSFISLDISVNSTGYVKYKDNKLIIGHYKIQSKEDKARRYEFAQFLKWLVADTVYDFIVIEDVIFGNNYKTTKILMQLNVVVEDLMYYNQIAQMPVYRQGNMQWKKTLMQLANKKHGLILKDTDDKEKIRMCLKELDFAVEKYIQDECDAMGIVLAQISIMKNNIGEQTQEKVKHIHTDLLVGYKLQQCETAEDLQQQVKQLQQRKRKQIEIKQINGDDTTKTLVSRFKEEVEENGDNYIFAISYPLYKIGALLLTKNFDVTKYKNTDNIYFYAVRR
jgi:hypothetical protein